MRTVLFAAVSTLCLAFAAHGAEMPGRPDTSSSNTQSAQPLSPFPPAGSNCIDNVASLSHAAYSPDAASSDDDADAQTQYCSQYLSTKTLIQAPATGHT